MKNSNRFKNKYKAFPAVAGLLLLMATCLSSCLKDNREDLSTSPPLVGFLFPSPAFYPAQGGYLFSAPLTYSSTAQPLVYDSTQAYPNGSNSPLEIELSYTSFPQPFNKAVTVTVGVDTSEISEINSAAGTNFLMMPSGSYTLPNSGQVTIEPVEVGNYPTVLVVPQVTTSMLDTTGGKQYILPLRITSAPSGIVIASNLSGAAMQVIIQ
jgi:hypothetical protein